MAPWTSVALLLVFSRPAVALFGASNETDFWEDFANNFATDLAPIISLFGEQVTKQFLSESTTILDTIVFAVGPLGIITAIVSCIRVCGGSFLRSVVGRAREPRGMAEIELCSSTSDDVCELWSNGGVCRVFGRPKILEFIYRPPRDPREFYSTYIHNRRDRIEFNKEIPATCGIQTTRDFFRDLHSEPSLRSRSSDAAPNVDVAKAGGEWKEVPNDKTLWIPFSKWFPCTSSRRKQGTLHSKKGVGYQHDAESGCDQLERTPASRSDRTESRPDQNKMNELEENVNAQDFSDSFAPFPNLALNIGVQNTEVSISTLWFAAIFGVLLQGSFFGYTTWATWYHPTFYEGGTLSNTRVFFALTMAGTASIVIGMALSARLIDGNSEERRFKLLGPNGTKQTSTFSDQFFWIQPGGQRIGDQEFEAFAHAEAKKDYITSWRVSINGTTSHALLYLAVGLSFAGWVVQFIGLRGQHATVSLYQLCCTVIMSIIRAFIRSYQLREGNQGRDPPTKTNKEAEAYWAIIGQQPEPLHAKLLSGIEWRALYADDKVFVVLHNAALQSSNIVTSWLENRKLKRFTDKFPHNRHMDPVHRLFTGRCYAPNEASQLMRIRSRLGFLTNQPPYPAWDFEIRKVALQLKGCLRKAAKALNLSERLNESEVLEPHAVIWSVDCQLWENDLESTYSDVMPICFQLVRSSEGWNTDENQLEAALGLWSWTLERLLQPAGKNLDIEFRDLRCKAIACSNQRTEPLQVLLGCWGIEVRGLDAVDTASVKLTNLSIPIIVSRYLGSKLPPMPGCKASNIQFAESASPILHLMAQDIFTIFVERVSLLLQDDLVDIVLPRHREGTTGRHQSCLVDGLVGALVSEGLATKHEAILSVIPALSAIPQLSQDAYIQRNLIRQANLHKRKHEFSESQRVMRYGMMTFSRDLGLRGFKYLSDIYRSELRWMLHHGTIFSRQDCEDRRSEMVNELSLRRPSAQHRYVSIAVLNWLLSNIRPTTTFPGNPYPSDGTQERRRRLSPLDQGSLEGLNLDNTRLPEALTTALTLSEQFNLADSGIKVRKQLSRWAIESDCTGLLEDIWASESSRPLEDSAFSRGFDEIFWAISFRTAENDMINTILFLLLTVEVPVSAPFQLQGDMDKEWWATSRQRKDIASRYEKFDNILAVASAEPNGLELVQILVDEVTAADLTHKEYEDAAWTAANYGNLATMGFLLSRTVDKIGRNESNDIWHEEKWKKQLLFAAKWGHASYINRLLISTPPSMLEQAGYEILEKAKDLAKGRLFLNEDTKLRDVPELDKKETVERLQQELALFVEEEVDGETAIGVSHD
ncbi:hypothetical protein NM208_g8758 [Fusarium decemcellulare]|uniref:Uncharacterized protein n=2 Tax=Fusarium decemcellulare TaxID=57161 RepID=A0ACC1S0P8_9HYPO|nr:hypothetical protein NM208_g9733 [Fusarium decemcellulare]KAJ3531717.1 hypothetical protein NM208_g8758 [Fusarium decemcellulare]